MRGFFMLGRAGQASLHPRQPSSQHQYISAYHSVAQEGPTLGTISDG